MNRALDKKQTLCREPIDDDLKVGIHSQERRPFCEKDSLFCVDFLRQIPLYVGAFSPAIRHLTYVCLGSST